MAVHGRGGRGAVPESIPFSQSVPSLRHLLGDAQSRAVTDVRFASSPGKARCPGPRRAHPRKRPSPRPYPPGQPRRARLPTWWLGCQRGGGASSPSPAPRLHRSERHVPGLPGRTPGNYYGLGRGKGGGGRREGREAEPQLPTLHPGLPQLLSMPSCPASPWEDFPGARAAAPGFLGGRREAGSSSCGGRGWRGCGRGGAGGVSHAVGSELEKAVLADLIPLSLCHPRAAPARPLLIGTVQKFCAGPKLG